MALDPNTLYYGDWLDWIEQWEDSCVDLIYLDPPFNSKANKNIIFAKNGAGDAQYRAFTDIWHWDDEAAARFEMFEGAVSRPAHDVIVGLYRFLGECVMLAYLTYMAERLEQMHRLLKPTGSIYLDPIRKAFRADGFRFSATGGPAYGWQASGFRLPTLPMSRY